MLVLFKIRIIIMFGSFPRASGTHLFSVRIVACVELSEDPVGLTCHARATIANQTTGAVADPSTERNMKVIVNERNPVEIVDGPLPYTLNKATIK